MRLHVSHPVHSRGVSGTTGVGDLADECLDVPMSIAQSAYFAQRRAFDPDNRRTPHLLQTLQVIGQNRYLFLLNLQITLGNTSLDSLAVYFVNRLDMKESSYVPEATPPAIDASSRSTCLNVS